MLRVSVFGTGYVGLVTGTCFAEMGHSVICADVDEQKIRQLNQGISPIYEVGLEELISRNLKDKRLRFTSDPNLAISESEIIFIAVGTPSSDDGSADLSAVFAVAETIGKTISRNCLIVTKSTVPVGTSDKISNIIERELKNRGQTLNFDVISNPEFLREGTAVEDCLKPERVIVGATQKASFDLMKRLYAPFLRNGNPFLEMTRPSAELAKYAANSFLATKISFMNHLTGLCDSTGADIEEIRLGMGTDSRIGKQFLYAGLGYGGSCFPKDVKALIHMGNDLDEDLSILKSVEAMNRKQMDRFLGKVRHHYHGNLNGKTFALWGLSFKPGTDDIRDAPSLQLIEKLSSEGARIRAYDPLATENAKKWMKEQNISASIEFFNHAEEAARGSDAILIATEWKQFREIDFQKMKSLLNTPVLFDGRNLHDPQEAQKEGFTYYAMGRGNHGALK